MTAVLGRLAELHGVDGEHVLTLWRLAGEGAFDSRAPLSSLCEDGTPFEHSLTLGGRPGGLRYLTELGVGDPAWRQLADARRRLPGLLDACALPRRPFLDRLDELLPHPLESFPNLGFTLWVAPVLRPGGTRLKVYINTSWWDDTRCRVFARSFPRLADRAAALVAEGPPAIACLEAAPGGLGRAKLYFRAPHPAARRLTRDGVLPLAESEDRTSLGELWSLLLDAREPDLANTLLSVAGTPGGAPPTVKVDFPATQLGPSEATRTAVIVRAAGNLGLDPDLYTRTLDAGAELDGGWTHTLVGITASRGQPRLNVYLKPVLRDAESKARILRTVLSSRPPYLL